MPPTGDLASFIRGVVGCTEEWSARKLCFSPPNVQFDSRFTSCPWSCALPRVFEQLRCPGASLPVALRLNHCPLVVLALIHQPPRLWTVVFCWIEG